MSRLTLPFTTNINAQYVNLKEKGNPVDKPELFQHSLLPHTSLA